MRSYDYTKSKCNSHQPLVPDPESQMAVDVRIKVCHVGKLVKHSI
jgi:hypothetical protein